MYLFFRIRRVPRFFVFRGGWRSLSFFSSHFLTRHNTVSHSILRRGRSPRPEKSPLLSCVSGAMCVPLHTQNGNGARPRGTTPPPAIFFEKNASRSCVSRKDSLSLQSAPSRGVKKSTLRECNSKRFETKEDV